MTKNKIKKMKKMRNKMKLRIFSLGPASQPARPASQPASPPSQPASWPASRIDFKLINKRRAAEEGTPGCWGSKHELNNQGHESAIDSTLPREGRQDPRMNDLARAFDKVRQLRSWKERITKGIRQSPRVKIQERANYQGHSTKCAS